ncbi:hypothetical protein [uncultured Tateyamaria sp.]|uniref:hypothetical protein n=1 Tax=uncultured Tateyamaria sp. TaxID=455651 RepID=UPI002615806E|nr:hypothetical protein [uncultured Tateyamaria sp.]
MRYKPCPRHPFEDTERKRAALRRKQKREREALPLFANQIAARQPSVDQVMADRAFAAIAQETRDRSARARQWREARRRLDAMPRRVRRALRIAWDCAPYPGDPSRLLGFLNNHAKGEVDLRALPFPLSKTDGSGARIEDLFETDSDWRFISILRCRDIAEDPDGRSIADRRAAYHHLQKAADSNKDRERGQQDRVLATALWRRLGEFDDQIRR